MFRERKFRLNLVVLGLGLSAPVFLLVDAIAWFYDHPSSLGTFGIWKFDGVGAAWLLALACWLTFPVHVGPDGLRATDGIGRAHDVPWEAMRRVRNMLGFLWVPHGRPGSALCFPIFLSDGAGFRDYVLAHAPEGNPLRAYLTRR